MKLTLKNLGVLIALIASAFGAYAFITSRCAPAEITPLVYWLLDRVQ